MSGEALEDLCSDGAGGRTRDHPSRGGEAIGQIMSKTKLLLFAVLIGISVSVASVLVQFLIFGKFAPWSGGLAAGTSGGLVVALLSRRAKGANPSGEGGDATERSSTAR